jgi:predicted dehydrogenase
VEKPFCCSSQEADQVIAQAKKSGKVLTVFQSE